MRALNPTSTLAMMIPLLVGAAFVPAVVAFSSSRRPTFLLHQQQQQQQHRNQQQQYYKHKRIAIGTTRLYFGETDNHESNNITMGLNELHTHLRDAVEAQDYVQAGRISGLLAERLYPDYATLSKDQQRVRRRNMSWSGLGAAPWLTDRLDSLNYTFPTTIQINSFSAVNAILNSTSITTAESVASISSSSDDTNDNEEPLSLEERVKQSGIDHCPDMGIVVSGTTGSGKSLAYAVPLLSTLSESLFLRQRLRVSDEEAVGDTAGDLVDRISVVTSPRLQSSSRKQLQRKKGAIATGASISSLGRSGTDVKSPLALVVVPTRELGVQTALLLYQLVGGNLKDSPTARSGKANMFKYKGPKGIRIGCVLDDEDASFGLKLQTDIAITTPQYLGKLLDDGDVDPSKLRVVVYDEADLALEQTESKDLHRLFDDNTKDREFTRLSLLVGASVTEALGNLAVSSRVLPEGRSYIATATSFAPLRSETTETTTEIVGDAPATASLKDLNVCLYPGLKHERVVVKENESSLLALTRLLRKELKGYELANEGSEKAAAQRPRVVVFFPDEPQARAAIEPLRDALWGEHLLCVLLPTTGVRPLTIMDQFKRNETSVMLATPNSVRGLDFPSLTHVYTLYPPDPREYLHLAGRVGRVGHRVEGHVISVLKEGKEANKMDELAKTLGFIFSDTEVPSEQAFSRSIDGEIDLDAVDVEKVRRSLEDTLSLVELAEDSVISESPAIDVAGTVVEDDDDENNNDDDGTIGSDSFQ